MQSCEQSSVMAITHQFLLIFLALPNFVFNDPICSSPYECIEANRCALRLSPKATEKILFRCEERNKICCPPMNTVIKHSAETHAAETAQFENLNQKYHVNNNRRPEEQFGDRNGNDSFSPTTPSTKKITSRNTITSHRNYHLLPSICGLQSSPNRITEGEEAELGEFPWMALVGVKDKFGNLLWSCGGTLINYRYVLTAAHCVTREEGSTPMVRLGEHNLENTTDCDNVNNFCLGPSLDYNVEEFTIHSQWNISTIKNDIALLRLSEDAPATFSVSPICLPIDIKTRNSEQKVKYGIAGWGKTEWNSRPSNVLLKGTLSSVSNEDCNVCKSQPREKYCPITEKQMCAQGWKSVDVCKGDSGGPLMLSLQNVYQVGITSFKTSEYCGADNIPSIFTRVESYLEWILDNIRE